MGNKLTNFKKKWTLRLIAVITICGLNARAQNSDRWHFSGSSGIEWSVNNKNAHSDRIEMSGTHISAVINYGVSDDGNLVLKKHLAFPMLRTIPNNTFGNLAVDFDDFRQLRITAGYMLLSEQPKDFRISDGSLSIVSTTNTPITVTRTIFPSIDKAALIESIQLDNKSVSPVHIVIDNQMNDIHTDASKGVYGSYEIKAQLKGSDSCTILPGDHYVFAIVYSGRKACDEPYNYSPDFEQEKRMKFARDIFSNLVLETPNDTLNREFAFAKLRTTESIFDTKGGLLHSPGGGFYAAIWANDQAEYANPFFPFLGNMNGNEAAINSFRLFAEYMNPQFKPIPSSIIAEGDGYWNGAGDRGDMAMIAYGASRFALASGKEETAKELWPLISWCLTYLEKQETDAGVIRSDADELEGRFPAGKINLSTNSLAYGAYISASRLATSLNQAQLASSYNHKASLLRTAIERYFGAEVQGFKTYRYYDGDIKLRSWICLPLVMGITERKTGTINALFSKYLWTANGILTEAGSNTFWDRATLYAFRGLLANGATDRCMPYVNHYSARRLLGEHVPYPVEAWPEANQRQLAAESALYCRVMTEGLFGITPTGFHSFTMAPWLPKGWNSMKLKNIKAFDRTFDIDIERQGIKEVVCVTVHGKKAICKQWDRKQTLSIELP